jgi:hypothetical protein
MNVKTSAGMKVKTSVKAGVYTVVGGGVGGDNPLCLTPPCRPPILPIGCPSCT